MGEKRLFFMMAIAAALVLPARTQESVRRDGNWWRTIGIEQQLSYMVGFVDGLALGHHFSYWSLKDQDGKPDHEGRTRAANAYDESYHLLEKTTNGQLVDGLNKLYSDYRNRLIQLPDAVWVVVMGVNGMSDKDMEVLLTNTRKNAGIQ